MHLVFQVYNRYWIDCLSEKEVDIVRRHFTEPGMKVTEDGLRVSVICDEAKRGRRLIENNNVHLGRAVDDWREIARELGRDFSVCGDIDTSFCDGYEMYFRIDHHDGDFSVVFSDWFTVGDLFMFESYEDFCESEGKLCSEEEFMALRDKLTFIIEAEGGNVLAEEVPLIHVFEV